MSVSLAPEAVRYEIPWLNCPHCNDCFAWSFCYPGWCISVSYDEYCKELLKKDKKETT